MIGENKNTSIKNHPKSSCMIELYSTYIGKVTFRVVAWNEIGEHKLRAMIFTYVEITCKGF